MEVITIDLKQIALVPNGSVEDGETIRQLALHSIQSGDKTLLIKINPLYEFAGLYPHIMKVHDINPEMSDMFKELYQQRIKFKNK